MPEQIPPWIMRVNRHRRTNLRVYALVRFFMIVSGSLSVVGLFGHNWWVAFGNLAVFLILSVPYLRMARNR